MQGRPPPNTSGMNNMAQQGLSMPPTMPSSPMTGMGAPPVGGNPIMMQPPPALQRGYSAGSSMAPPFATYNTGSPMAAPPGTPTATQQQQQQQRLLQLQIQQQQQQLMQLQQQQTSMVATPNDPSSQTQFPQLVPQQPQQQPQSQQPPLVGGPIAPPPASPSTLKRPSDLPSPSDMLQLQGMQQQQQPQKQTTFRRSGSISSIGPTFTRRDSGGSVSSIPPAPPLFQRSTSQVSSGVSSAGSGIKRDASAMQHSPEQVQQLLSNCNAMDRTIYVAKQLLGGSTVNGFLRGTAAAQRIKKQRARQVSASAKRENPQAAAAAKAKKMEIPEQQREEELKLQVMNVRTAKKLKTELEGGIVFCTQLHAMVVSILKELDPHGFQPAPLGTTTSTFADPPLLATATTTTPRAMTAAPTKGLATSRTTSMGGRTGSKNPSSPGDPSGSTLRKLRKKKSSTAIPSSIPKLSEYDETGKRKFSRKEYMNRVNEMLRFRALKAGDYVAARVSSRDLWILAVVVKDYGALDMGYMEFLQLSDAKRNSLFREKVSIKDADEKDGANVTAVPRSLVLPLPRTYAESSEWGARCKKGARVYAMYPMTTSLYSATVIDSTTYCRGEDDIIVVEFDGDEADPFTGALPQYHIPARFVTLIPREFPASQTSKKKRTSSTLLPPKASNKKTNKNSKQHRRGQSDDALNDMLDEMSQGAFPVDGDLAKFEQFEMGAIGGPKGIQPSPMPPNPGLYRK